MYAALGLAFLGARRDPLRRRRQRRPAEALVGLPHALPVAHHPGELGDPVGALRHALPDGRSSRCIVVPLGVATAVYLEEYADRDRWYNRLVEVNIQNLAAVPSVVYGILGLAFIVRGPLSLGPRAAGGRHHARPARAAGRDHRRPRGDPRGPAVDPRGRPSRSARRSGRRSGSRCCPGSIAGIATGVILALSRAIGETAPLLVIGAAASPRFNPTGSIERLHGAADPDLRLDPGPQPRVRRPRRGRDPRPDDRPAADELRRDLPAQPIRAEVVTRSEWPRTRPSERP